jgi:hypothetical protein
VIALIALFAVIAVTPPTAEVLADLTPAPRYEHVRPLSPLTPIKPSLYAAQDESKNGPSDNGNQEQNESKTIREWFIATYHRTTRDPVALFTFVLSVSTIGLWIVTWRSGVRQSREMNAHIAIVQKSMVTAERAYISVRTVFFGRRPFEGEFQGIDTGFTLRNTGNTFTKHMMSHSSIRIFNGDIPATFDFPDLDERPEMRLFIAPESWVGSFVFRISREELVSCIGGRRRIFVWGWADYNDVFPNTQRHRTEFCYEIVIARDPSTGPIDQSISTSQYRRHNAADDECDRRPKPYTAP